MAPRITVVGLGPGDPAHLTDATRAALASHPARYLRTAQHPSAGVVLGLGAETFDDEYERHSTFDAVYAAIVERLVAAARAHGAVVYAVPGSPLVLERTVDLLRVDARVDVRVEPAVGFLDAAWAALGVDPFAEGVRLVDAHRFAEQAAGARGPMLVAQCHANWVLSDVKLAHESASGDEPVALLVRLGTAEERVVHTTWAEMDRVVEADHLTSLWIPSLGEPVAGALVRLHGLARTLRDRCPWDREQTHGSLVRYLLEETYEVVEAISALDPSDATTDDAFIEELGDLLYQVEFHATIAEQEGRFTMADVARAIHDKLVRRHPHVFGDAVAESAGDVVSTWEEVKRREREATASGEVGPFDGVARAAPALMYAAKVQRRAADRGFDWPSADGPWHKLTEESLELRRATQGGDPEAVRMEVGDLLFSVVNLARHLGADAETALRGATEKFRVRFEGVLALAGERGVDLAAADLAALDALWDEVKARP